MEIFNWRYYWAEILAKADSKLGTLMLKYYQMEQKKIMIMNSNESLINLVFYTVELKDIEAEKYKLADYLSDIK